MHSRNMEPKGCHFMLNKSDTGTLVRVNVFISFPERLFKFLPRQPFFMELGTSLIKRPG